MTEFDLRKISPSKDDREPSGAQPVVEFSRRHLPAIAILVVLFLAVGFKAAYSYRLDRPVEASTGATKLSGFHSRELALVEAFYLDHQKGSHNDKHSLEMLRQLRKSQAANGSSKDGADVEDWKAVWLTSAKDEGVSLAIQGTALSADAVASLISDLETTGYFKNIEIRETYQDDKKHSPAFQFELTCEFAGS